MKLYRIRKSNIDRNGRGLYAIKDIKEGTLGLLIMLEKLLLKKKLKNVKNLIIQNQFIYLI